MATAVMWVSLAVFNLGTVFLLRYALKEANLPNMLSEKAAQPPPPALPVAPGILAADQPPLPTSSSRIEGIVGAIVLAEVRVTN